MRKRTSPIQLFPAREALVSVALYILGLLPKSRSGRRFRLFVTDRFKKLTPVLPLRKIDAYIVARAFADELVFKYWAP